MTVPATGPTGWHVERIVGGAEEVHARAVPDDPPPSVWVVEPTDRSVVLGSTQPVTDVDAAAAGSAGVSVCRRRSGGGAVLVTPGSMVWVDVIVPRDHAAWTDDIGRASVWMGERWAEALGALGVRGDVVAPPMSSDPLARVVCFVGRGPGEVVIASGAKVVGVAQRRTRSWARFQCAALLHWDPDLLLDVLAPLPPGDRRRVRDAGAGLDLDAPSVVASLLDTLS